MSRKRVRAELQPPRTGSEAKITPGMEAELRALNTRTGPPSEHDAPRPTTFPGPAPKQLPGQTRLL